METIKEVWYAVVVNEKIQAVYEKDYQANVYASARTAGSSNVRVERVRVTIDRIKTS